MNCKKCGADIGENRFCPQCGTPASTGSVQQTQGSPTKVLVFGIIGLALSGGIVGLIFSIIGLVQANRYRAEYGDISRQVNIGRSLSIAGIIIAVFCTIATIVAVIVLAANWPQIEQAIRDAAEGSYEITYRYSAG